MTALSALTQYYKTQTQFLTAKHHKVTIFGRNVPKELRKYIKHSQKYN